MVSTHLKNISQNGNLPQIGVKIKNIWKHQTEFGIFHIYPTSFRWRADVCCYWYDSLKHHQLHPKAFFAPQEKIVSQELDASTKSMFGFGGWGWCIYQFGLIFWNHKYLVEPLVPVTGDNGGLNDMLLRSLSTLTLHPRSLTRPLKNDCWKTTFLLG